MIDNLEGKNKVVRRVKLSEVTETKQHKKGGRYCSLSNIFM